jgi:integrase/recombinase XerC
MEQEIDRFLNSLPRSPRTIIAYQHALKRFVDIVSPDAELNTATYIKFLQALREKSASTQRVYTTAVLKFYKFNRAGDLIELQEATQRYRHKTQNRVVRFDRDAVGKVITHCESLGPDSSSVRKTLVNLRDRAFVLTLADTGLRISEACALKLGDMDWKEQRAIISKGNSEVIVRFSRRSLQALTEYLAARAPVEPDSRVPYSAQPLFARHDIRASKKIHPITSGGMWKTIKDRVTEAGVERRKVRIHDFRHYFVATAYLATRDLKISQELARHRSISTTQRYIHLGKEVDDAYNRVFNRQKDGDD